MTVWVLTGPTASGKSSLGLAAAERHGLEILSMDSMAVYSRMDIGIKHFNDMSIFKNSVRNHDIAG